VTLKITLPAGADAALSWILYSVRVPLIVVGVADAAGVEPHAARASTSPIAATAAALNLFTSILPLFRWLAVPSRRSAFVAQSSMD
jgi:hypothetical protein